MALEHAQEESTVRHRTGFSTKQYFPSAKHKRASHVSPQGPNFSPQTAGSEMEGNKISLYLLRASIRSYKLQFPAKEMCFLKTNSPQPDGWSVLNPLKLTLGQLGPTRTVSCTVT